MVRKRQKRGEPQQLLLPFNPLTIQKIIQLRPLIEKIVNRRTRRTSLRFQREELVQDAITRAWRYAPKYDIQRGNHEAFVSRITHSEVSESERNMNRARAARRQMEEERESQEQEHARLEGKHEIEARAIRWMDRHVGKLSPKHQFAVELLRRGFGKNEIGRLLRHYYSVQKGRKPPSYNSMSEEKSNIAVARRVIKNASEKLRELRRKEIRKKHQRRMRKQPS